MRIKELSIRNYRLLENVVVALDPTVTLIVGRNNSGKTSLTEVFNTFFDNNEASFRFEDFSITCYPKFREAVEIFKTYKKLDSKKTDQEILKKEKQFFVDAIPQIVADIFIEYQTTDNLASLSDFIMDLDPNRYDATISCRYCVSDPVRMMENFLATSGEYGNDFVNYLKRNFRSFYHIKYFAVDRLDKNREKEINSLSPIRHVFLTNFITAQRNLDDQSKDKNRRLSKGFEDYYRLNKNLLGGDIAKIEKLLETFAQDLDKQYGDLFQNIFNDLKSFGIKDRVDLQPLLIKAFFDSERILRGNTQLYYRHDSGLLPESYNGLGYSNLIFMILQFISFYELYDKTEPRAAFQVLFIEEPEAHLHPQMQRVFIRNIEEFISKKKSWTVQMIITTHSSHIVEESGFSGIRYFDNSTKPLTVKNLSEFQSRQGASDIRFLKQYMTLKNCDMFFADKIIMVEGTVERLLIPRIIQDHYPTLRTKYLSVIEVGGAYAHKFKAFLEFINVKTLIITDLDATNAIKENGKTKWKACTVSEGVKTSNAVLKEWLPKKDSIEDLISLKPKEKVSSKGNIRVTYQIPEKNKDLTSCGRSFEEAFIIRNAEVLIKNASGQTTSIFSGLTESAVLKQSYDLAEQLKNKKTDFAFDVALIPAWNVPKYIHEGLEWLQTD